MKKVDFFITITILYLTSSWDIGSMNSEAIFWFILIRNRTYGVGLSMLNFSFDNLITFSVELLFSHEQINPFHLNLIKNYILVVSLGARYE